jgi:hypothetical protein
MTRGLRLVLAAATGLLLLPSTTGRAATTTSSFDAVNLRGGCAALELTVATGYSFVVQPDVQLPRATTVVENGSSQAIASPADPGDSVDSLAGLGVPQAEGYIVNGYPAAPSPFAGRGVSSLPKPLNSAGDAIVKNPFNPTLTYPYEHADAGYPSSTSPGTQTATLAHGPDVTAADPSGFFGINAGAAKSVAGDGFAVADGGSGAGATAVAPLPPPGIASLSAFGVSAGRVSAHSEAHVLADRVTHDATCTLHDLDVAVPGAATLHVGAVVATVHTERLVTAAHATATESIEFSGVTVNGNGATLDQNGLTVAGHRVTTLPAASTPPPPATLPAVPGPGPTVTTPPRVSLTGTAITQKQPSPDEAAIAATGATVTIQSTTPIPNALPPTGVSATPTVYTLHVASLTSESYGLLPSTSGVGLGDVAGGVAGILGGGLGAFNPATTGAVPTAHPGTSGQAATLASIAVTPFQRGVILAVSSLLEGLLLVVIARNYIRSRRRITAPVETTDLP